MATYDVSKKSRVIASAPRDGDLGIIHVRASGLPAPATGDIFRLAEVPAGCVPVAWWGNRSASMGTTATGKLYFSGKTEFASGIAFGSTGPLAFTALVPTDAMSYAPGSQGAPVYLNMELTSVSGGTANGAFELFVLFYRK